VIARRIPPSLCGLGLIEEIDAADILANARRHRQKDSIGGRPNMVNGQLGRFGVKAQVPTLFEFMYQAALTEMGLTSPFAPR
jgi:CxxC motif-containing protein (DUF1111 family)